MANSELPETAQLVEKLSGVCDGPPIFRNLNVVTVEKM